MNACSAIRRQLMDQCPTVLPSELDSTVMEHLQHCAGCRRYAEELNSVARDLLESSFASPKASLSPRILLNVAQAVRSSQKRHLYRLPKNPIAISGLAIAITLLFFFEVSPRLHRTQTRPDLISVMSSERYSVSPNLSEFAVARLRQTQLDSGDDLDRAAAWPPMTPPSISKADIIYRAGDRED